MAVLNLEGFETGDTTQARITGGTISIVTSPVRTGIYALRSNPAVSTAGRYGVGVIAADGLLTGNAGRTAETFYTTYLRLAATPSGNVTLCRVQSSAGTIVCRINCDGSRQITLVGATTSSVIATLALATWYRIDIRATSNATCAARVDGGTEQTCTGGNVNQDWFDLGRATTVEAVALDCYYDDVLISDTSWPDAGQVGVLIPDGDGTYTAWASGTGTTFAEVDEAPNDGDTTYVGALDTGDNTARTFSLTSCASAGIAGTILAAKHSITARTDSTTGTSAVGARLRSGSTDSDTTGREWTTSYAGYAKIHATDPSTAAAWTTGGLDAAEIGVFAGTIAQIQRLTATRLQVWYSGGAADQTMSPDPATVPLVVPAPVVTTPYAVAPDPVATPLIVPAPTLSLSLALAPSPVAIPLVVPTPAVTTPYALAPSPVAIPLVVPAPSVSLGAITVAPDPVAIPLVIPQPAITTPLALTPDPVPVPLVIPAPTITAPANLTLTPDPVAVALVVPQPTVTSAVTPVPPVVVPGGGGWPTRGPTRPHPFPPLIPEPVPPSLVLHPEPVVIMVSVMMASVTIDWLSKLRAEDEELLLAGVL